MLTLTYFTTSSNLFLDSFVWEKGKTKDFSETIVVYGIKVGRCSWYKVTQIQHFQISFPEKRLGRLKPNFIWSLHGMGEQNFVQMVQVT